jgi:hypothetical protein
MKAVVARGPAIAKAKRKALPDVNPDCASGRPQKKRLAMSPRRHNAEKQATNFSESVRIGIEAAHWPIAELPRDVDVNSNP